MTRIGPVLLPSELTSRVELQQLSPSVSYGELHNKYVTIACVAAKITPRSSFTIRQSDRVTEAATHLVMIRYRSDVKGSTRLKVNGRTLDVLGLPRRIPDSRPQALEFECTEVE